MMHDARNSIRQARRLIDFYASQAERAWLKRDGHAAAAWASIAAEHAFGLHPGYFASPRLERLLVQIAHTVPTVSPQDQWHVGSNGQRHILHVLTTAYAVGGHARITERWARSGATQGEVHSVILLNQGRQPIPPWLGEAIESTGGRLIDLREPNLIRRAAMLRAQWRNGVACVIVTSHPYDVVPTLAFGIEHGAPVYVMNAADHVFWLGVSIADAVIDIRMSGQLCSQRRRGVRRSQFLPIPLVVASDKIDGATARQALGIPNEACVLLTVASAYKYRPMPPWNFMQAVGAVMERQPHTHIVAAGPRDQVEWQSLRTQFPDRVHLLGEVLDLQTLHTAADIYLDSLPFASLTATLEAGLSGLPIHLPWNRVAPLMSNGDPALSDLPCYAEPKEYVQALAELIDHPEQWSSIGQAIARRIRDLHVGVGWTTLAEAIIQGGGDHAIEVPAVSQAAEAADLEWVNFQSNVPFLTNLGVGLYGFKEYRRQLSRSGRMMSALRLLISYPRYLSQPRRAARVAYEIMQG